MSEDTNVQEPELTEEQQVAKQIRDNLEMRAAALKIKFHPNISNENLAERIKDALAEQAAAEEEKKSPAVQQAVVAEAVAEVAPTAKTAAQMRHEQIMDMTRLIRVRITCHDPSKQDQPGFVFTVANGVVGSLRKFVPYNTDDDGYHLPFMMVQELKQKTFTRFFIEKDPVTRREVNRIKTVRMFAIEELPQLTPEELAELAKTQAAAGIIE